LIILHHLGVDLQLLSDVIIIKSKVLLLQVKLTIADLQLQSNVIIIKSKVLLPQVKLSNADLQLLNNVIIIKSKVLLVNRQWSTLPEGEEPYF
jgi:hypothetical protein